MVWNQGRGMHLCVSGRHHLVELDRWFRRKASPIHNLDIYITLCCLRLSQQHWSHGDTPRVLFGILRAVIQLLQMVAARFWRINSIGSSWLDLKYTWFPVCLVTLVSSSPLAQESLKEDPNSLGWPITCPVWHSSCDWSWHKLKFGTGSSIYPGMAATMNTKATKPNW
jgi:hypothetical protein